MKSLLVEVLPDVIVGAFDLQLAYSFAQIYPFERINILATADEGIKANRWWKWRCRSDSFTRGDKKVLGT